MCGDSQPLDGDEKCEGKEGLPEWGKPKDGLEGEMVDECVTAKCIHHSIGQVNDE